MSGVQESWGKQKKKKKKGGVMMFCFLSHCYDISILAENARRKFSKAGRISKEAGSNEKRFWRFYLHIFLELK